MSASVSRPYPIEGTLQHYAWGGYNFLPNLLGRGNPRHEPTAELWLGTHPKGPTRLSDHDRTLDDFIAANPVTLLGNSTATAFGHRLPFLFKLLDVREMLSIQVHPTKEAAAAGFAREEANGPPRDAPNRNYRDDNHKPELGVALSDFYLLHGFRSATAILRTLNDLPGWTEFIPELMANGPRAIYRRVMTAGQAQINEWLAPVVDYLEDEQPTDPDHPDYWAARAVERYSQNGNHDRGMFSIYWFNLVHLRPGEGIFQAAGVPHAYLRGSCVEIMANSDNVIRGGLTPKHIDVPELLRHVRTEAVTPKILYPQVLADDWDEYPVPVNDFSLGVAEKKAGEDLRLSDKTGPSVLFLLSGHVKDIASGTELHHRQRAVFVPAGLDLTFMVLEDAVVYRAGVNPGAEGSAPALEGHHVSDA